MLLTVMVLCRKAGVASNNCQGSVFPSVSFKNDCAMNHHKVANGKDYIDTGNPATPRDHAWNWPFRRRGDTTVPAFDVSSDGGL